MHEAARRWVEQTVARLNPICPALEIGGRNVNGSVRDLFGDDYTALDILPGEGVDIVADAALWQPDRCFSTVVCTECFEHSPNWPAICSTIYEALDFGGLAILTMAGPGRVPHSAEDGGGLRVDEHYENVEPDALWNVLKGIGFTDIELVLGDGDLYAVARR